MTARLGRRAPTAARAHADLLLGPSAEPATRLRPVTGVSVEDFYEAYYPRLVRLLLVATGSRGEAEDVAQEAFIALLPRWSAVREYDDPEAWVRLVAFRLAGRRRQRVSRLLRLHRGERAEVVAPPDADQVDLDAALATLSPQHRAVVALHYFADLPVADVSRVLDIPVGTVKSRLSRARTALGPLLIENGCDHGQVAP